MKPDLLEALRASVEAVRGQIPARELTVGSVERLLRAADALLADADADADAGAPRREEGGTPRPIGKPPAAGSKRQQAREKWARIARQNATEMQAHPGRGE
jgi:hypothetical protein